MNYGEKKYIQWASITIHMFATELFTFIPWIPNDTLDKSKLSTYPNPFHNANDGVKWPQFVISE